MNELFGIAGKVAIITGAGGVLGGNIAKHFMRQGAKVVAVDVRREQLDKRVSELEQYGSEIVGIVGDVLDVVSLEKLAGQAASQAAKTALDAGVKKLVIGHFSSRYEDESILLEEAKKIFPETVLAKENLKLTL